MKELLAFALVLLRLSGFVISMPVIGTSNVAPSVKALLALTLTFIMFPQVGWQKLTVDIESMAIVTLAIKEIFIGVTFGFLSRLFFLAVTMAGQIMSVSLGLSSAQLFNPAMGESTTALDYFYVTLASLFFFAINGHHAFLTGIFDTFTLIPIEKTTVALAGLQDLGTVVHRITVLALKMGAPIMVAILFMNVAVAVVGRAVPQINILITSMPVNILAGFFVMFVGLPLLLWQMTELTQITAEEMFSFLKSF